MDAMGWDVVYPTEINLPALYNAAQSQVANALRADRINEVEDILDVEAYNWARRSSSTGFWWGRRSSSTGFWQVGYWSTYESATTTTENSADFDWQNSEYSEIFNQISNWISNFLANIDWDDLDWGDLDWGDLDWSDHDWSNSSSDSDSSYSDSDDDDDDDDDDD